jgi:arylsulfatase A-like enzyme
MTLQEGLTVTSAFVSTPVCCPARASLYTGKYIHNIGVTNNSAGSGGCSSLRWQLGPERFTFASYLHQQGYATSFAGKVGSGFKSYVLDLFFLASFALSL